MADAGGARANEMDVAWGDITITPWDGEFLVGRISEQGRWTALETAPTLEQALRLVREHSRDIEGRVLVSRDGGTFELFEPARLWLEPHRIWRLCDLAAVLAHVPPRPGVYVIRAGTPIMIGDTDNLRERLLYQLEALSSSCAQSRRMPLEFCFEVLEDARVRSERANHLIIWWAPPCNQRA